MLGAFDLPDAVCAAVPQGCGTAVDLGCGTGAVLSRLLPLAQGVIGVDGSARMLELCRRRFNPGRARGRARLVAHWRTGSFALARWGGGFRLH